MNLRRILAFGEIKKAKIPKFDEKTPKILRKRPSVVDTAQRELMH